MSDKVLARDFTNQNTVINFDMDRSFDQQIDENQTLEMNVKKALYSHTEFSAQQIITQSNKYKYHDVGAPTKSHDYLTEIVDAMASLNKQGLTLKGLGQVNEQGVSFKDALEVSILKIATRLQGKGLIYVELGPEPIKTSFILQKLLDHGVKIARYIAVDINPASEAPLRPVFENILGETPVDFVNASFEDFSLNAYLGTTDEPALITMLGFQEGNDDPYTITNWLQKIARKDDMLLSEVQLYSNASAANISSFYRNPMMQRFSRIAFEQGVKDSAISVGRFYLLPVQTSDGEYIFAAILCEEFLDADRNRKLFVSNYCLKFDFSQYQAYREIDKHFKIVEETLTQDETLLFQVSVRN
jgi:hypothetical protein